MNDPILRLIRKDLAERKSVSFEHLLNDWEDKYGAGAVPSLIKIASDLQLSDPDRYIALMGSAKLGGEKITTVLLPFLKDPNPLAHREAYLLSRPQWRVRLWSIEIQPTRNR